MVNSDFIVEIRTVVGRFQSQYLTRKLKGQSLTFDEFTRQVAFSEFRGTLSRVAHEEGKHPYEIIYDAITPEQKKVSGPAFKVSSDDGLKRFNSRLEAGEYDALIDYFRENGTTGDIADILYALNHEDLHQVCSLHKIYGSLRGYLGRLRHGSNIPMSLDDAFSKVEPAVFEKYPSLEHIFYTIEVRRLMATLEAAIGDKALRFYPGEYNDVVEQSLSGIVRHLDSDIDSTSNDILKRIRVKIRDHYQELYNFSMDSVVSSLDGKVFPNIYQREGIQFIFENQKVLIADEMGTGKTAQAVLGALYLDQKTGRKVKALIVTPNNVKETLYNEIRRYVNGMDDREIVVINGKSREDSLKAAEEARFVIINYELVHRSRWREDDLDEVEVALELISQVEQEVQIRYQRAKSRSSDIEPIDVARDILYKSSRGKLRVHKRYNLLEEVIADIAKVRMLEKDTALVEDLSNLGFNYVVLDEVHNAKNLDRYTTKAVRKLAKRADHLVLLSGTPAPNGMKDLEVIFELLGIYDRDKLRSASSIGIHGTDGRAKKVRFVDVYGEDPRWIRDVLRRRMLRRHSEQVLDLPPLYIENHEMTLSHDHRSIYQAILDNECIPPSEKLTALRKCLLDPSLLKVNDLHKVYLMKRPDLIKLVEDGIASNKYQQVESCLQQLDGEKAVIFTSVLKNGVTEFLEARFKAEYGVLRIDGDVNDYAKNWDEKDIFAFASRTKAHECHIRDILAKGRNRMSEREMTRRLFMGYKEYGGLIATSQTMKEGISLTAANHVIEIDKPYTNAEVQQRYKRVHREGQTRPVHVISLIVRDTVDIGIEKLIHLKKRASELMIDGADLTKEELDVLNNSASNTKPIKSSLHPCKEELLMLIGMLQQCGAAKSVDALFRNRHLAEIYANNYVDNTYSIHSAHLTSGIVRFLKADSGRILDLASGYGYLGKILGKPIFNLDVNPLMLARAADVSPQSRNILGVMQNIPFAAGTFGAVVYSLAFSYATPEERPYILDDIGRVMQKDGLLVVVLPSSRVDIEGAESLENALDERGFEINEELTGFYRNESNRFKAYAYVGRKVHGFEASHNPLVLAQKEVVVEKMPIEYARPINDSTNLSIDIRFTKYTPQGKNPYHSGGDNNQRYGGAWVHNPDGTVEIVK